MDECCDLVLTIPMTNSGQQAINHLREYAERDLGCTYIAALHERLQGLESSHLLLKMPYTFHLVRAPSNDQIGAANRILRWHDGREEGGDHGLVESADANFLLLPLNLGTPFKLGGKHSSYLTQMRYNNIPHNITGKGVHVAIVDTGLESSSSFSINDYYDVELKPPGPQSSHYDNDGHGTAMTTLIRSVAKDVEISVISVLDPSGGLPLWNVMAGVAIGALDCKADIINLSLGIHLPSKKCACGATLQARINAYDKLLKGISMAVSPPIYVASTGNDGYTNTFDFPAYQDETLAVGAVNSSATRSSFTNYGTSGHNWHLMAPGGEKVGTTITEDVGSGSKDQCCGTSPAAAYATGMLAILRSEARYRSKSRDEFLKEVKANHCELPSGANTLEYGAGQIVYDKPAVSAAPSDRDKDKSKSNTSTVANVVDAASRVQVFDDYILIDGLRLPRHPSR